MFVGPAPVTFTGQYIEPVTPDAEPFLELFATVGDIAGARWHELDVDELRGATIAMVECVHMAAARVPAVQLTVNIDPRAVNRASGDAVLEAAASLQGRLTVEILENAPLCDDTLLELRRWHTEGIALLMDDYGTGHADDSRLHVFPWHGVKVAGTLTRAAACGQTHSQERIRKLTDSCSTVIAEGIEDHATYQVLQLLGVSHAQGWFIDRPGLLDRFAPAR